MHTVDDELIPLTLLTGFLGSGKTTVLNHLVRQPAFSDVLVIIDCPLGPMPIAAPRSSSSPATFRAP